MAVSAGFLTCVFQHSRYFIQAVLVILAELTLSSLILTLDLNRESWFFIINHNNGSKDNTSRHSAWRIGNINLLAIWMVFTCTFELQVLYIKMVQWQRIIWTSMVVGHLYGSDLLGFYLCFFDLFYLVETVIYHISFSVSSLCRLLLIHFSHLYNLSVPQFITSNTIVITVLSHRIVVKIAKIDAVLGQFLIHNKHRKYSYQELTTHLML